MELVARSADRVVLLGEGQVVVDGPTRQVISGSLVFASQVNKLYRDPRYLVVEDAVAAPEPVCSVRIANPSAGGRFREPAESDLTKMYAMERTHACHPRILAPDNPW